MPFRLALLLVTLSGFGVRVYGLHYQSFWLDEVDAIAFAAEPVPAHLRKLSLIGENGPLYFLLFKGWLALAGQSEFGARALSAFASTLTIPLTAQLAERLFASPGAALVAAALAAASPFSISYAQDAKMYPLYAALALGAQYCFVRGWDAGRVGRAAVLRRTAAGEAEDSCRPPWPWWLGYVACSSLGLYVHLFAALQLGANTVAGLWLATLRFRGRRAFAIATAALIGPYLPLAAWQAPVLLRGADVGYSPASLQVIVVTLLGQLTWHLNRTPPAWWLWAFGAVLGLGLWRTLTGRASPRARVRARLPAAALLICWLLVPVAGTLALQGSVPVFRDRYLTPLLAPLLLLVARAIVPPWNAPTLAAMAFVVSSFAYSLAHRPLNPDFRAAARLVHANLAPGETVGFLAEYAERPFLFYYRQLGGQYEKVTLPYTNYPGMSDQEALSAVTRSVRAGRGLWLVQFEDWLWDGRAIATQYLAGRGAEPSLRRDFNGVSVTHYTWPGTVPR